MLIRPVLVYDGQCGFCRKWISRLRRWDRGGRIEYVTARERNSVSGLPRFTDDAVARAMHLVTPDGRVLAGARALPALLDYLPGGALVRPLFRIPGLPWVADRFYAWLAARRHRFGCGESCGM
ncbi:MAG TPA: DUF393 domain-containing protein [Gemmatimonadales bacterium]|nr:DUF393 domain-containing protein [Gemmatimonadales bacterium]